MRALALVGLVLSAMTLAAAENPYVLKASKEERSARISALAAAYEAMDHGLLSSKGKRILIKEVEGMIVVSFLNYENQRIYGGEAHVTYDPKLKKVVDVLGED